MSAGTNRRTPEQQAQQAPGFPAARSFQPIRLELDDNGKPIKPRNLLATGRRDVSLRPTDEECQKGYSFQARNAEAKKKWAGVRGHVKSLTSKIGGLRDPHGRAETLAPVFRKVEKSFHEVRRVLLGGDPSKRRVPGFGTTAVELKIDPGRTERISTALAEYSQMLDAPIPRPPGTGKHFEWMTSNLRKLEDATNERANENEKDLNRADRAVIKFLAAVDELDAEVQAFEEWMVEKHGEVPNELHSLRETMCDCQQTLQNLSRTLQRPLLPELREALPLERKRLAALKDQIMEIADAKLPHPGHAAVWGDNAISTRDQLELINLGKRLNEKSIIALKPDQFESVDALGGHSGRIHAVFEARLKFADPALGREIILKRLDAANVNPSPYVGLYKLAPGDNAIVAKEHAGEIVAGAMGMRDSVCASKLARVRLPTGGSAESGSGTVPASAEDSAGTLCLAMEKAPGGSLGTLAEDLYRSVVGQTEGGPRKKLDKTDIEIARDMVENLYTQNDSFVSAIQRNRLFQCVIGNVDPNVNNMLMAFKTPEGEELTSKGLFAYAKEHGAESIKALEVKVKWIDLDMSNLSGTNRFRDVMYPTEKPTSRTANQGPSPAVTQQEFEGLLELWRGLEDPNRPLGLDYVLHEDERASLESRVEELLCYYGRKSNSGLPHQRYWPNSAFVITGNQGKTKAYKDAFDKRIGDTESKEMMPEYVQRWGYRWKFRDYEPERLAEYAHRMVDQTLGQTRT